MPSASASTVVVEQVFVLPGVGRLVFQAIANRDLVVVRDVVLLLVAVEGLSLLENQRRLLGR